MTKKNTRLTEADLLNMVKEKPHLQKSVGQQIFRNREMKEFIPVFRNEQELSEQEIQSGYFSWVLNEDNQVLYPLLKLIFAIPNGTNKSIGQRVLHKRAGLISGIPDFQIAVARKPFFGAFVEVKTWKAYKLKHHNCSLTQLDWHERLRGQGFKVSVMHSVSEMIAETKNYLGY